MPPYFIMPPCDGEALEAVDGLAMRHLAPDRFEATPFDEACELALAKVVGARAVLPHEEARRRVQCRRRKTRRAQLLYRLRKVLRSQRSGAERGGILA